LAIVAIGGGAQNLNGSEHGSSVLLRLNQKICINLRKSR
jgi:hypothetical protein